MRHACEYFLNTFPSAYLMALVVWWKCRSLTVYACWRSIRMKRINYATNTTNTHAISTRRSLWSRHKVAENQMNKANQPKDAHKSSQRNGAKRKQNTYINTNTTAARLKSWPFELLFLWAAERGRGGDFFYVVTWRTICRSSSHLIL